jgi:peptidoglycan/LPS O-acetylase OafA/YrhL
MKAALMISSEISRIKALDGLRGFAALTVTFFHAMLHTDESQVQTILTPSIFSLKDSASVCFKLALMLFDGGLAVIAFYVLSGYVLQTSLSRTRSPLVITFFEFAIKRLTRLLPAMIACMMLMVILSLLINAMDPGGYPYIPWNTAIKNAFLIKITHHGPSTSVQVELLAAPFIFLFFLLSRIFGILSSYLLICFSILAIQISGLVLHFPNLHPSLIAFYLGSMLATPAGKAFISNINPTNISCSIVLIITIIIRHLASRESIPGLIATTGCVALFVGMLANPVNVTAFHNFLCGRFAQFLGRISYSYYLLNIPVLYLVWYTFGGSWILQISWGEALIVGTIAAAFTCPLAWLSERYIETGGISAGRFICARLFPYAPEIPTKSNA